MWEDPVGKKPRRQADAMYAGHLFGALGSAGGVPPAL
jgi:hypothetical protein